MSASPRRDLEAEVAEQEPSPDEQDQHMESRQPELSQPPPIFDFEVKEQDRWLPIANVSRIMKTALPENAKIAKEAKECMQECVSEFISFITSEASEKCQQEKRKTVNGEDILFAMTSLGFENYAEALKIYLAKYRESQSQRNQSEGQRGSTSASGAGSGSSSSAGAGTGRGPNYTTTATASTAVSPPAPPPPQQQQQQPSHGQHRGSTSAATPSAASRRASTASHHPLACYGSEEQRQEALIERQQQEALIERQQQEALIEQQQQAALIEQQQLQQQQHGYPGGMYGHGHSNGDDGTY